MGILQIFTSILFIVLGILLKHWWQKIERRPCLRLKLGIGESDDAIVGFFYAISNMGAAEVPDYELTLFHPGRGTLGLFRPKQSGPLLPAQERQHHCVVIGRNRAYSHQKSWLKGWLHGLRGHHVNEIKFDDFSLRVTMKSSDRILFESREMGNLLAKKLMLCLDAGTFVDLPDGESAKLSTHYPRGWRRLRYKLLVLVGMRQKDPDAQWADWTPPAVITEDNRVTEIFDQNRTNAA